jgi:hypothetical protein
MGLVASNIAITIGHTIIAMSVVFMIMPATSQTGRLPPRSPLARDIDLSNSRRSSAFPRHISPELCFVALPS